MNASYRLVLADLDGTLLSPERLIRQANTSALGEIMQGGVRVGLATGRMPRSAAPYVETVGATGPLILLNGAMVWDVATARPVYQAGLPMDDAVTAMAMALANGVHVNAYVAGEIWIARVSETSRRSENKDGVPHRVVPDLVDRIAAGEESPVKLILIDEVGDVTRLHEPLRANLANDCTLVNSEPAYLEVLPPGVTKGSALDHIHRHYGIAPDHVLAFGDGLNDLELLTRSGLGVAMANAHPAVKEAADIVIGPHTSDAIGDFLRSEFTAADGDLTRR
ncbi:MAG: HAD family hydrolase [Proteobacteria bacterium]|nr:HAD family hydrolase [Pseudomonadota bacterium]